MDFETIFGKSYNDYKKNFTRIEYIKSNFYGQVRSIEKKIVNNC